MSGAQQQDGSPVVASSQPSLWSLVGCVAIYVLLGSLANLHAWIDGPSHTIQISQSFGDVTQSIWSLGYVPHALVHGQGVLATNWLNFPVGYNLMANTSVIFPALLLSPITALFGPVTTYNLAVVLGFAGSATGAMLLLRRYVDWLPAAFIGGLLYGFSPALTAQGAVHLHLIWCAIPPLMMLVLDSLLVRDRRSPWVLGVALGVLAFLELMTSAETLVVTAVVAGMGLVVLVLLNLHHVRDRLTRAVQGLGLGLLTFVVLGAYPLVVFVHGPAHVRGVVQSPIYANYLAVDLVGIVAPTSNQLLAPGSITHVTNSFMIGNLPENGPYLGILLVIALLAITVVWWRAAIVRFSAIMLALTGLLTLGSHLQVDGRETSLPLPFFALSHLALTRNVTASRFEFLVALFAALLLGVGIDRMRSQGVGTLVAAGRTGATVGMVGAVVVLVPLIPSWPYASASTGVPRFFSGPASTSIPVGSVVLTFPMPEVHRHHNQAMLWQVLDHVRYRLAGSYGHTPLANGEDDLDVHPSATASLFDQCYLRGTTDPLIPAVLAGVRGDLARWDVGTVVISHASPAPGGFSCAIHVMSAALTAHPVITDDVAVFSLPTRHRVP